MVFPLGNAYFAKCHCPKDIKTYKIMASHLVRMIGEKTESEIRVHGGITSA